MSLTGIFQREDIYCQKYWRQVQHVCNEIWTQREKEVFATNSSEMELPQSKFSSWRCSAGVGLFNEK